MIVYADTSFLVSLFARDANSGEAIALAAEVPHGVINPLHRAEFENAIALCESRRQLTAAEATAVRANFAHQLALGSYLVRPWPEETWVAAERLSRQYIARLGVRMLDVLHVAAALEAGAAVFLTFDGRQRKLARLAGLRCRP